MKKTLKVIVRTMELIFIVFCLFIGSLFFRQQRLPGEWVEKLCERFSSEDIVFNCDSASIGFSDGLHFDNLCVYDRTRRDNLKPIFSSDSLSVWFLSRKVRIIAAKFPRLNDSYYYPELATNSASGAAVDLSRVELPDIPSFSLELVRPDILGVAPETVTAEVVVEPKKVDVRSIRLNWPDQDVKMWLDGFCTVDFLGMSVIGDVHGTAKQEHIRPLLKALDLPVSYEYMGGYPETGTSGFTEVIGPVPAYCGWKVDLRTCEFNLDLDLHPVMGRYNNVRLKRADGKVGVHVYFTDTYMGYDITIGPLEAVDLKGRNFGGKLVVHGTNNLDYLEFDAHSGLEKQDTLDIMGYLNKGTLDEFKCLAPANVTAKGIFNCNDVNIRNNDFGGHLEVAKAEFFGYGLSSVAFDYRLKASEMTFTNVTAKGITGGDITGSACFHVPLADGDEDFSGGGRIDIRNGKLVRIPMFLALTSALADNVPGIDKLVNQSEARCDFTISNGVFRTENLVVQGALFCIKLSGSYDFASEELNFIAHCTVMKEESLLGKYLIQPMLWPFTKLLTEFEITGKAKDPKLRNTSVKSFSEKAGEITTKTGELLKKVIGK